MDISSWRAAVENMFDYCEWALCYPNSIWSETNEKWSEGGTEWRTVGAIPNKFMSEMVLEDRRAVPSGGIPGVFPRKHYCIVEFPSGRLEVGYCLCGAELNTYVILEADRGEDCGKVVEAIEEYEFESLRGRAKEMGSEVEPKRILRQASQGDFSKLKQRKETEMSSLRQCRELVSAKGLNMEILNCEYQWDMKKITFYFRSDRRIDFRDLLKDLFKLFKTRIWMCAERRTNSNIIRRILE